MERTSRRMRCTQQIRTGVGGDSGLGCRPGRAGALHAWGFEELRLVPRGGHPPSQWSALSSSGPLTWELGGWGHGEGRGDRMSTFRGRQTGVAVPPQCMILDLSFTFVKWGNEM